MGRLNDAGASQTPASTSAFIERLNGAIHARVDCDLTLHQRLAKS
jgi:hypothetical protein